MTIPAFIKESSADARRAAALEAEGDEQPANRDATIVGKATGTEDLPVRSWEVEAKLLAAQLAAVRAELAATKEAMVKIRDLSEAPLGGYGDAVEQMLAIGRLAG